MRPAAPLDTCSLDWLQSLKQFFINVSYHILVASLTLKQFLINVLYHILVASLTLMALFKTEPSELD